MASTTVNRSSHMASVIDIITPSLHIYMYFSVCIYASLYLSFMSLPIFLSTSLDVCLFLSVAGSIVVHMFQ